MCGLPVVCLLFGLVDCGFGVGFGGVCGIGYWLGQLVCLVCYCVALVLGFRVVLLSCCVCFRVGYWFGAVCLAVVWPFAVFSWLVVLWLGFGFACGLIWVGGVV